jgi:hypothetical protein
MNLAQRVRSAHLSVNNLQIDFSVDMSGLRPLADGISALRNRELFTATGWQRVFLLGGDGCRRYLRRRR